MTVLRISEDERGILRIETDIPSGIGIDAQVELIAGLQFEMMASLRGGKEISVFAAIFAVGLASALLCEPMDEYLDRFDKDAGVAVRITREGIRQMSRQKGIKFFSGPGEAKHS